ncbi:hypothetical protein MKW94_002116 [Papaver nudicaule]|uniref:SKP1-like protein n=1 Tax=Papaver nudicaule TaxID=74823 RepID=A0AA41RQY6_PAPNU|nr:hypothetical protein [Papaver nudicaule]
MANLGLPSYTVSKSLVDLYKNLNVTEGSGSSKSEKTKMVTLKTSDNKTFVVKKSTVLISETIRHLIEDDCAEDVIPLQNITGEVLEKVLVFLKKHAPVMEFLYGPVEPTDEEREKVADEIMMWDTEFIEGLESDQMLFDLIFAANYLDISTLMELTCEVVARKIRDMTPEQIRDYLRIENDYSPEAEAKVRADNAWAFKQ